MTYNVISPAAQSNTHAQPLERFQGHHMFMEHQLKQLR
jgi:hypothetical protein